MAACAGIFCDSATSSLIWRTWVAPVGAARPRDSTTAAPPIKHASAATISAGNCQAPAIFFISAMSNFLRQCHAQHSAAALAAHAVILVSHDCDTVHKSTCDTSCLG